MAMLNNQMVQYIEVIVWIKWMIWGTPKFEALEAPDFGIGHCRDGDHECSKVKSCFNHDLGMLKIWGSSYYILLTVFWDHHFGDRSHGLLTKGSQNK